MKWLLILILLSGCVVVDHSLDRTSGKTKVKKEKTKKVRVGVNKSCPFGKC